MTAQSLIGRKVLITAYDLEQSEHRGIAVYTKALIRCLAQAGARVWLLTEFALNDRRLRDLPQSTRLMIQSAHVLSRLADSQRQKPSTLLERKFELARKIRCWSRRAILVSEIARRPRYYRQKDLCKIRLDQLHDNPYPRLERLNYLKYIEGIVCAPELFFATQLAAMLKHQQPVEIDLSGFDMLLTSCPLNLWPRHISTFVQTVHDLIPLEIADYEDPFMFSNRLQACLPARRLFVSQTTAIKYFRHIKQLECKRSHSFVHSIEHREVVVVQPPSLQFPDWLTANPKQVSDLRPVSYLLRQDTIGSMPEDALTANYMKQKSCEKLQPFCYLLFNSSVEPRKNLVFLAQAYAESDLNSLGIQLCVTGKLKGDDYSHAVQEIVARESGILLTGYIDETTKLDLYLNSLCLLSPSLVEGFGIPVLDAACLGMTAIVSDCDSHREIQALHDFRDNVITLNMLHRQDWIMAMQAVVSLNSFLWRNPAEERRRRISRYRMLAQSFSDQLQDDLQKLLS
ncbi:glycosyl transferase group 1 [cyanobiont of Ornithocercus magnificus]|nr:glycosyl transferase group 1 [cyanobiont of Ornithocercus magnificus]